MRSLDFRDALLRLRLHVITDLLEARKAVHKYLSAQRVQINERARDACCGPSVRLDAQLSHLHILKEGDLAKVLTRSEPRDAVVLPLVPDGDAALGYKILF